MKKCLFAFVCLCLFFGCSSEDESIVEPLSLGNFFMAFNLRNIDLEPAYNSNDEYLADTSQAPHSPVIKWSNGETTSLKFQMFTGIGDSSLAGPHFFCIENPMVIDRVLHSSLDSTATGLIHWNKNQIDTLSFHAYDGNGLAVAKQAQLVIYNSDTVFNQEELYSSEKYQFFYSRSTIQVVFNSAGS